ncbi:hypothetical protein [Phenylobacterium sp.]|uniref:hypothetical protein n=1 Tax=Phenylobacterium sp. TaxID=1871053 RepID=UPI002FCBEBE5
MNSSSQSLPGADAQTRSHDPSSLLEALNLSGLPDNARLLVMTQNPARHYHWNKSIGGFTAGQVRGALMIAAGLAKAKGTG